MIKYHLFDKKTKTMKVTEDHIEFAKWFEDVENRVIARNEIGDFQVSTVCLGIDHNIFDEPELFETMVFNTKTDETVQVKYSDARGDLFFGDLQQRYATYEDALAGHCKVVRLAIKELNTKKGF